MYLKQYMVESTVGQEQQNRGNEMNARFSEHKSQLVDEKCALDADSPRFLDIQKVKSLLELTNTALVQSVFSIVPHIHSEMARSTEDKWTPAAILQHHSGPAYCATFSQKKKVRLLVWHIEDS